jgi:hypothetical protein
VLGFLSVRDRLCSASAVNHYWCDCKAIWTSVEITADDEQVAAVLQCSVVSSLETLSLYRRDGFKLTEAGWRHLATLSQLQHLDLTCCRLRTDIDSVAHLPSFQQLRRLDLADCRASDNDLQHVSSLVGLQHLDLGGHRRFSCTGLLQLLSSLVRLQHLDLAESDLSNTHLKRLTGSWPRQLRYLDLSSCTRLSGNGLKYLAPLTQLQHLELNWCSRITDQGLQQGAWLLQTKLRHLSLHGCDRVTDAGLKHLSLIQSLRYLDITGSDKVTDTGMQHLASLAQLQCLVLKHCLQVSASGLQHLTALQCLERLDIRNNRPLFSETELQRFVLSMPRCAVRYNSWFYAAVYR